MLAQVVKQIPGVEAAVVAVGKHEAQCVGANGFDTFDLDIPLAGLQGFLARAMAAGFGRRGEDPQELVVEFMASKVRALV